MSLKSYLVAFAVIAPILAFDEAPTPLPKSQLAYLWTQRNVTSLDLLNGSGGKEHAPRGVFTFAGEDKEGTNPKFDVVDEQGNKWKAKLGEEAQSETAATRLVWAAGYFVDEDYYLPELHVRGMKKLKRGDQYVSPGGIVRNVRMERTVKGQKKTGNWSWFRNAFTGTREFNGLRVMMALIDNWDLKEVNNAIYDEHGEGFRYVISDLGATFGKTGNPLTRSKNNPADYEATKFIQKTTADHVDFFLSSRPFILAAVDVPNYAKRTHMEEVVKNIPRADAKWLGTILAPLSEEQLRDCFRAAGYAPEDADGNAAVVRQRITELTGL